jgi:hypothetical protein
MLAEARWRRGEKAAALAAAAKVETEPPNLFAAAMVQIAAGEDKLAAATAAKLGDKIAAESRALGKLLQAEAARTHGKPDKAIEIIQEALQFDDSVLCHFALARVELDARRFADAVKELQQCNARRGELTILTDSTGAMRYTTPILYYLARAQEGAGDSAAAAKTYAAFLALQPKADHDQLVDDARKRAGK